MIPKQGMYPFRKGYQGSQGEQVHQLGMSQPSADLPLGILYGRPVYKHQVISAVPRCVRSRRSAPVSTVPHVIRSTLHDVKNGSIFRAAPLLRHVAFMSGSRPGRQRKPAKPPGPRVRDWDLDDCAIAVKIVVVEVRQIVTTNRQAVRGPKALTLHFAQYSALPKSSDVLSGQVVCAAGDRLLRQCSARWQVLRFRHV